MISNLTTPFYWLTQRVFRTIIYEMAVAKAPFDAALMWIFKAIKNRNCDAVLDEAREVKGLASLAKLGATFEVIYPKDGLASIHVMQISSRKLEEMIQELGGRWEKIDPTVLAIIPPEEPTWEWSELEDALLRLKWHKKMMHVDGKDKEVIVTSEHADLIDDEKFHSQLFLHANSASVTFGMLTRRWGLYLGCKQSICAYNPRGVSQSLGVASEGGHYNDIAAVYEKIRNHWSSDMIWITSACGGGPSAAYLRANYPELKRWIFENGYTDLKDCVKSQAPYLQWMAPFLVNSLKSSDISQNDKPVETGYDLNALVCQSEPCKEGVTIVVRVVNDQVLPLSIHKKNILLAKRLNDKVIEVLFNSSRTDQNYHVDRYFNYTYPTREVLEGIFNTRVV